MFPRPAETASLMSAGATAGYFSCKHAMLSASVTEVMPRESTREIMVGRKISLLLAVSIIAVCSGGSSMTLSRMFCT